MICRLLPEARLRPVDPVSSGASSARSLRRDGLERRGAGAPHSFSALPLLVALAAGLTVAACGETAEEPAQRVPEAERAGGTAVVCSQSSVESLNPFVSPDQGAVDLGRLLFTSLVLYEEGAQGFRPYLARDWSWSDDGSELTLELRDDVTWHDGEPVTAADVAWTVRTAADPDYGYFYGSDFRRLQKVQTPDSVTVVLRFDEPPAGGLEPLVPLPILPRHLLADLEPKAFSRSEFHRSPVGSGPFELVERRQDGSLVFERWQGFPDELGRPYLDRLVFRTVPERAAMQAELRTGGVDACLAPSGLAARLREASEVELRTVKPEAVQVLVLNTAYEPLGDVQVRRAVSAALRRSEIAAVVSPLAEPAGSLFPPSSPWRDTTLRQVDADSALADSLLSAAGWRRTGSSEVRVDGEGNELRLEVVAPPPSEDVLTVAQAQLQRLGIGTDLRFMEWSAYVSSIMNPETRPDVMALSFQPEKLLAPDHYSTYHSRGRRNVASYSDARVDSVLVALRGAPGEEERERLYATLERRVVEDVPVVYLTYVPRVLAVGPRLEGVAVGVNGPLAPAPGWWIPPSRRRR